MSPTDQFFDALETRPTEEREGALFAELPTLIADAQANSPYFEKILNGVAAPDITNRAALAALPVTRKSDLLEIQKHNFPFGGMTSCAPGKLKRIYQSPGPIYDPEGYGEDWWGTARALYAAGFRAGDILHNTFAYHLTPAGAMLETGAAKIGCAVVPAGVGNTELQVRAIADIKPTGYAGTPSFLVILLDKARELGEDCGSLTKAIVGGEALPPSLRQAIEDRGVSCGQVYASADLGCIAYESDAREGLIADERLIIEIVRPGTNEPVADGDVGEVVATLFRPEYPLIRFATGDLSAIMPGPSPCGRTNMRLKGWMGRADQTTKVKGMFVHPSQIADIVKRHPGVLKARLVVDQRDGVDVMTLNCEVKDASSSVGEIATSINAVCKLKGEVLLAEPGSLPNDGKVIDDVRSYE
jgi:phenylacetate-CoA ligase